MSSFHITYSLVTQSVYVSYSSHLSGDKPCFMLHLGHADFIDILQKVQDIHEDWDYEVRQHHLSENNHVQPPATELFSFVLQEETVYYYEPGNDNEQLIDDEAKKILDEIHARLLLLRKRGISSRTIREQLLKRQTLSHLHVTSDYRLILTDYGNLEVELTPLPKALYLLFLRHPEGIAFKRMSEHRDELTLLYAQLAPNINPMRRQQHIKDLIDPMKNSLNEKVSIIHRAFARILDSSLLPHYAIEGSKGAIHSVKLPQSLLVSDFLQCPQH